MTFFLGLPIGLLFGAMLNFRGVYSFSRNHASVEDGYIWKVTILLEGPMFTSMWEEIDKLMLPSPTVAELLMNCPEKNCAVWQSSRSSVICQSPGKETN